MTPNQRKVLDKINNRRSMIKRRRVEFVACLLGCGWTAKEIALRFNLSRNHVVSYQTAALRRFKDVASMVKFSIHNGFGLTLWVAILLSGCATPTTQQSPPVPLAKKYTTTTVTLGWDSYTDTNANALILAGYGTTILPITSTSYRLTGLRVGTTYTFTLCATNLYGSSCTPPLSWQATTLLAQPLAPSTAQ